MFAPLVRGWKDLFGIKLTPADEAQIENENLRVMSAVSLPLGILECILLIVTFAVYVRSLKEHASSLISLASCVAICMAAHLLTRKWISQGVDKKKIRLLTACMYWIFSVWGIAGSVRHYMQGSQMLIFDTVQIGFALLLYVNPIRAAIRVLVSYSAQLFILWTIDRAAGIQIVNYYMLAALIVMGYAIRYLQQIRGLHQKTRIIEKNEDLVFDSTHDSLTGMKNRLALRQDFSDYIGKELYVVMADVDSFKQYNDQYGHDVGDRVLAGIGKLTLELFGYDTVYRYGGDEFLIILRSDRFDNVDELLLVWDREVSSLHIDGLGDGRTLRCSHGVAHGRTRSKEDVRKLLLQADDRMYAMKQSKGRM